MRKSTDEAFIKAVGVRIHELRKERGLSLCNCARRADVDPSHLLGIEIGEVAATTRTLNAIAGALGVALADLFNVLNDDMAAIFEMMRVDPRKVAPIRERVIKLVVN